MLFGAVAMMSAACFSMSFLVGPFGQHPVRAPAVIRALRGHVGDDGLSGLELRDAIDDLVDLGIDLLVDALYLRTRTTCSVRLIASFCSGVVPNFGDVRVDGEVQRVHEVSGHPYVLEHLLVALPLHEGALLRMQHGRCGGGSRALSSLLLSCASDGVAPGSKSTRMRSLLSVIIRGCESPCPCCMC